MLTLSSNFVDYINVYKTMFDQSFSSESFQEIFDIENRKGSNIERKYKVDFSESLAKINRLRELRYEILKEKKIDKKKPYVSKRKK